jgi:outer membrane biosynthesis protein TonB
MYGMFRIDRLTYDTSKKYLERGFKRMPKTISPLHIPTEMKTQFRAAMRMDPLDGISSKSEEQSIREIVKKTVRGGGDRRVEAYLKMNGGVIVGKGAYGTAWSVPASAVLNADFTAVASIAHPVPARLASLPPPSTRVVVKIAKAKSYAGILQGYHEMRVHAYLADPSIKTGDLPNSSDYVPKYYAGGFSPTLNATVTVMELVDGKTVSSIRDMSPRTYADLEKAFTSLWARRIFHADAHSGNVFAKKDGGIVIIDFGLALVLPESLRAKTIVQATSVEYFKKLDEFAFLYHAWQGYDFSNPNTLALRVYRQMVPVSNAALDGAIRNARGRAFGDKSPAESGEYFSPSSGRAAKPAKKKPSVKKPAPKMPSIPKPAPKMPSIPKPAPKMPSIPKPAPKMPSIPKPSPAAKKSSKKLAPPRISFGSSVPTPLIIKKKTELLAMARAMKREGYDVGAGYDILLKPDLAKRIENAKKAGKDSVRAKTVKNLKANAKRLEIKGAYAMKRANLVNAIRRKKA